MADGPSGPDAKALRGAEAPGGVAAGRAAAPQAPPQPQPQNAEGGRWARLAIVAGFLMPALVILGALVLYPIFFSVVRSVYDRTGDTFVGLRNYQIIFTNPQTFTAVKNNVIWVIVAPSVVTAVGLVFAVLTERIRWATAFKVAVFMPMAISFLATGVIWRLVYDEDPRKGLANAFMQGVAGVVQSPGQYSGARPRDTQAFEREGSAYVTSDAVSTGETVAVGLIAFSPRDLPADAGTASQPPAAGSGEISGTVWLDLTLGGGGREGEIDPQESGLPGVAVEAVRDGRVVATATTEADGTFSLAGLEEGEYQIRLAASNFRSAFPGLNWLGPTLVTPGIIVAYIWMWAGFAMVVIGAGLAAIPRDVMEAARVDGANEWQVFRRVTVPLLAPVLAVVFVTLAINVLKIFDLVLVMTSGTASAASADVIALRMWRAAFGGARDFGLGSALAVFLFLLVIPAMAFNIKRFRTEGR